MLLVGDIPDLIYFQGGDAKMADQGILEDLNPWIEQSPNLKAALWPHNVERLTNYPYLLYVYPAARPAAGDPHRLAREARHRAAADRR